MHRVAGEYSTSDIVQIAVKPDLLSVNTNPLKHAGGKGQVQRLGFWQRNGYICADSRVKSHCLPRQHPARTLKKYQGEQYV